MERVHLHTIQQLQIELADTRERTGTYNDDSRISQISSKSNVAQYGQENGNQFDNGDNASGGNTGLLTNENSDNGPPFSTSGNPSVQVGASINE